MTVNLQATIDYMVSLKNRGISYSMNGSRNGSDGTGDCSGTVVQAIQNAGGTKYGWLYNTDSMHAYLLENGYELVYENQIPYTPKKGDVFIWGKKGQSGGAFGHTGIFYDDSENIIHCNYGYDGVTINNVDNIWTANGNPYFYIYRLKGSAPKPPTVPPVNKPSKPIANRRYGYRVDDVQTVNGILQVRTNSLAPQGFTWTDNGVPTIDIDMINPSTGEMLADQNTIKVGQYYAFNPKRVTDSGKNVADLGTIYRSFNTTYGDIWLNRSNQHHLIYG